MKSKIRWIALCALLLLALSIGLHQRFSEPGPVSELPSAGVDAAATNAVEAAKAEAPAASAGAVATAPAVRGPEEQPKFFGPVPGPETAASSATPEESFPEDVGIDVSSEEARAQSVARLKAAEDANKRLALKTAREKNWPVYIDLEGNRRAELAGITKGGEPVYTGAFNALAALSANIYPLRDPVNYMAGGVMGQGWKVGVWEPGRALLNHPEFGDRATAGDDNNASYSDHATHVIGTIIAEGQRPDARGMAPKATVSAYTAGNDTSEMTGAAANSGVLGNKIFVSNHSYGTYIGWDYGKYYKTDNTSGEAVWIGSVADQSRDINAGLYDAGARSWDALVYSAGYYLPFKAAGNDRGGKLRSGHDHYWRLNTAGNWEKVTDISTAPGEDGGRPGGYESLSTSATAKNVMIVGNAEDAVSSDWTSSAVSFFGSIGRPVIGFVDDLTGSEFQDNSQDIRDGVIVRDPSAASPNPSSAWGPTDDGRIKPDIMANGTQLYSTSHETNGQGEVTFYTYDSKTGTSMAGPSAAGAAILLQQYHHSLFGAAMRSSMLKALILHTADDLDAVGPDYRTGWGLINAKAAADFMKLAKATPGRKALYDSYLADADPANPALTATTGSEVLLFNWDFVSPQIKVTIVWNDPPGAATTQEDRTTRLRNDLDLRLITPSGKVIYPWVLDPEHPEQPAARGDNVLDNVEQVVATPEVGRYVLIIQRKRTIVRYEAGVEKQFGKQPFSLVITGNGNVSQFQEGLDQPFLAWNSGGDAPWTISQTGSADRVDHAECKFSSSLATSFVETEVVNAQRTRVSWWWSITGPDSSSPILFVTDNGREVARINRTSGWQPMFIDLPPGRHQIRWTYTAGPGVDAREFAAGIDMVQIAAPQAKGPFTSPTPKIPGTIQAENFDLGEAGDAYVDSDTVNDGGVYRTGVGVDIRATTDAGGGFVVFNTRDGEAMEYTTEVTRTGLYTLELRYAAAQAGSILRVGTRDIELPSTGGANNFQTLTVNGYQLVAGTAAFHVEWVRGGASLNWMNWILQPWPTRAPYASASNPGALPLPVGAGERIQVEDFDTGGESIAYHDTETANLGVQYRPGDSVDIKASDDPQDVGGFQVTRFQKTEYLRYTILVPEFDDYDVRLRIKPGGLPGFNFGSGLFAVRFGGSEVILGFNGSVNDWITLTGRIRQAPRGRSDLSITCNDGMADVNWIEISRVPPTGITKILYPGRTGVVLNDFYPEPRGKGQFPRGFIYFSHPLIERPDQSGRLNTFFEAPVDGGDNYGVILAGYIVPSVTADYTFYLCSDDQGELWLSTDENPANTRLIAREPEWSPSRSWISTERRPLADNRRSNVSAPIRLEANRRYYVEAAMKEGAGGDNLAVAWRRPGEAPLTNGAEPISAAFLRPLDHDLLYEVRVNWPSPAPITYGTPLSAVQLNMTLPEFQLAGTISYDPPAGTVLPAGTHTLRAIFTPLIENESSFQKTTNAVTLVVNPAPLTIRANSAEREVGLPNPNFTATIIGLASGDSAGHLKSGVQFKTAATPSSPVGAYVITPFGAVDPNYAITFQTGTLTLKQSAKRAYSEIADGTPLPGRIEAEAFDHGGEGLAYADFDASNVGGAFRPSEGVDLEPAIDVGGGFNVGWTAGGEWQEYTVNVAKSGLYNLKLRGAQVGVFCSVRVWMGGQPVTGNIFMPDTGGYQNWVDINRWSIPLSAGKQVMRVEWVNGGGNLNWIEWTPAVDQTPENILWWKFNSDLVDSASGRALLSGAPGGGRPGPVLNSDSPTGDPEDKSVVFDGISFAHLPEVDEARPVSFEARDYTVEAWVKFVRPAGGKSLLVTWGRPGFGGWSTWIDANGNLGATSYGIVDVFTGANLPSDGNWHHVAFVHQLGVRMQFFVDGQLKETVATGAGVAPTADHTLHVGYELVAEGPINAFVGKMDRLRITDRALQASQLDYPARPNEASYRGLNRLVYRHIDGDGLDDFYPGERGRAHFPSGPEPAGPGLLDSGEVSNFEAPVDIGDYYGQILFGYIVPSVTANYTFYVAADNHSELWLSTDASPANSVLIASCFDPVDHRNWTGVGGPVIGGRPSNISAPVRLDAGKFYYVEAPMKEGWSADHLAVAWRREDQPVPEFGSAPISADNLRTSFIPAKAPAVIPSLSIYTSEGTLEVSWIDTPGFILERTTTLAPGAAWTPVTFRVANGEGVATVSRTTSTAYFRLRRPQ